MKKPMPIEIFTHKHNLHCFIELHSIPSLLAGAVEYINCRERTQPSKCPGYDTKLHQIVRLQSWKFGECGVPLYCHYCQIYSDLEL